MYKVQVIAKKTKNKHKTKQKQKNQKTKKKTNKKNQTNGKVMYECGERWCRGGVLGQLYRYM